MKEVKIGNRVISDESPCLISFEPSGTFSSFNMAKEMIKACFDAGADAVKFQTFLPGDADRMMGKKDIAIEFGTSSGKKKEFVYDALKRRELSKEEWKKLRDYSQELGLIFITAGYFEETIDFLAEIKIDALKVSKGDINNTLLIDYMAKTNIPIILDGREKFEDVEKAIKICEKNSNNKIIVMHCPSGYPAENSGVHLNAIKEISKQFPYPVGFADHSPGDIMNFAAIALGVKMLEKTITSDKNIEQVEHFMSLELNELKNMVTNVRAIEDAMGTSEILKISRVAESARRSLVAKRDIQKNEQITLDCIDYQRPGDSGISCSNGFELLNKKANTDIKKDTFLQWEMFS